MKHDTPISLPVPRHLPVPLSPIARDMAIEAMSLPELRTALRWMAATAPRDFAGAVQIIEQSRDGSFGGHH